MLGIPCQYLNVRRPGSIVHWYRSLYEIGRRRRRESTGVLPVKGQVEPTVRCNLACTFCHSQELRGTRPSPDMSLDQFRCVVDELSFLLELGIVGMGEPTLHPNFVQMVEYVCGKDICAITVTNCNRHSPEISKQLVSIGLKEVRVSVDGAAAASYEKGRKGADFERTLENLSRLVSCRGNRKYPRINVQMLPFDYSYREMPDLVRLCARIGVDGVSIQARLTDWGKDSYVHRTLQKGGGSIGEDFERCLECARQIASEQRIRFEVIRGLFSDANRCPKPWREIYVSTTGDVVPCCAIADPRVKSMGNLFNEPFSVIWNNKPYLDFRRAILSGKIPRCCFQCYAPHVLRERSLTREDQYLSST